MKIFGVYFICCLGDYLNIIDEQLKLITESGLYEKTEKLLIFLTLFSDEINSLILNIFTKYDLKQKYLVIKSYNNEYEKFAINNYKKIITDITENEYYLYYIHTKGVSKNNSIMNERRKILNYYTINKFKINLMLLDKGYDAVGCTLLLYPKLHFSGNFWWSKSNYMNKLHDINNSYLSPEMYILSNNDCKYISLSNNTNTTKLDNIINLTDEDIIKNITTTYIDNYYHKNLITLC